MTNLPNSTLARHHDSSLSEWIPALSLREALSGEPEPGDVVHRLLGANVGQAPGSSFEVAGLLTSVDSVSRKARKFLKRADAYIRQANNLRARYERAPSLALAAEIDHYDKLAAEYRALAREAIEHVRESLEFIEARARADANRLDEFLAAARQNRVIRSRATHAPQRSTREPRRRASRSAAAATRAGPAKGDDPDPEPSSRVLVCQKTAPAVLGWSGRRFIEFVRRKGVRHTIDRRRIVALLGDVLAALGLGVAPSTAKVETIVDWRARAELKLVGGLRGER
jgi:hypothetical protein